MYVNQCTSWYPTKQKYKKNEMKQTKETQDQRGEKKKKPSKGTICPGAAVCFCFNEGATMKGPSTEKDLREGDAWTYLRAPGR